LGFGDWAQSPSPIPYPQSPIPNPLLIIKLLFLKHLTIKYYFFLILL